MSEESNAGGGRLLSQDELDRMCRPGVELIHEAIDSGDAERIRSTFNEIIEVRAGLIQLMIEWTSTTLEWVLEEKGPVAMSEALEPDFWLELGLRTGIDLEGAVLAKDLFAGDTTTADRMAELTGAGDVTAAKRLWEEVDASTLKVHDYRIDWLTAVLTHVYRTHGVESFNQAMLKCAYADWWKGRMVGDMEILDDPIQRVKNWTFFLGVGNWGTISVSETDEAFSIHHAVCGSCGRQELRGMHDPPVNLARVTEPIPGVNFGDPNYTIYRTHLAIWHFVMPIAERGHPWPAIKCEGVPGRCWFTIYKDPMDTPESYYESAGLVKPSA